MNFDEWAKSIFKHGTDAQYGIAKAAWDEAIKTDGHNVDSMRIAMIETANENDRLKRENSDYAELLANCTKRLKDKYDIALQDVATAGYSLRKLQQRYDGLEAELSKLRNQSSEPAVHIGWACWADNDTERCLTPTLVNYDPTEYPNKCKVYAAPVKPVPLE